MKSHRDRLSLEGKNAIVTGASSGLGVTFAKVLAEAGARVVVSARRVEKLNQVIAEIEAAGGQGFPVECDVTDPAQVEAMVAQAWNAGHARSASRATALLLQLRAPAWGAEVRTRDADARDAGRPRDAAADPAGHLRVPTARCLVAERRAGVR